VLKINARGDNEMDRIKLSSHKRRKNESEEQCVQSIKLEKRVVYLEGYIKGFRDGFIVAMAILATMIAAVQQLFFPTMKKLWKSIFSTQLVLF